MNEADSPRQPTGLPTPTEPTEIPAVTQPNVCEASSTATNEGWETVDFPGAMSVDTIPNSQAEDSHVEAWHMEGAGEVLSQGVIHYSSAEISPEMSAIAAMASETSEIVSVMEQKPLELTQERFQQLLQELERSHQTAQRQQILVETLTEQLGSSQERIAQLERDCALTQQRHNEQVQQVLQAESACRDLRLRLHRQQQQTLQFKAALEKCLEMPTAYGHPVMADVAAANDVATADPFSALLPKNSPVQPWSVVEKAAHETAELAMLPRPLFRLLNGVATRPGGSEAVPTPFTGCLPNGEMLPADQSALLDSDDPQFVNHLMQVIFPAATAHPFKPTVEVLQAEPMHRRSLPDTDVEPDAERANTEGVQPLRTTFSPDSSASGAPAPLHNDSTDPLWDDLATLIDPSLHMERTNAIGAGVVDRPNEALDPAVISPAPADASVELPASLSLPDSSTRTAAIPPFATDTALQVPVPPLDDAATTAPSQAAWSWRDRLSSAGKVSQSTAAGAVLTSELLALSAGQPEVSASSSVALTSPAFAVPPSPLVYPLRAARKLDSLAAVDLPTFPKR